MMIAFMTNKYTEFYISCRFIHLSFRIVNYKQQKAFSICYTYQPCPNLDASHIDIHNLKYEFYKLRLFFVPPR